MKRLGLLALLVVLNITLVSPVIMGETVWSLTAEEKRRIIEEERRIIEEDRFRRKVRGGAYDTGRVGCYRNCRKTMSRGDYTYCCKICDMAFPE